MIVKRLRYIFPYFYQGLSNSYTQIFFSKNKILGGLLILVSFFNLNAGISGLIAVITANVAAYLIGLNRQKVISGLYGFNALLVGLGLGLNYQPNIAFFVVIIFASLLTIVFTTILEGLFYKYNLPYLSIPFLLSIWIVALSTRQFNQLFLSEMGIYMQNEMYLLGGLPLVKLYNWTNALEWSEAVKVYFRSLGAIFFQYHLVAGLLIATGLVIWSRLAFLLSIVGFAAAWYFYNFIGANMSELSYSYIGFNFILTSIAIGGFFVVPSVSSFLWVLLSIPLLVFLNISGSVVLGSQQLGIYSLPFNVVVILFIYLFRMRERFHDKPTLVYIQQNSPEKNLYSYLVNKKRLSHLTTIPFKLPFWGKWIVTQGIEGEHTHKDVWKYAWDFEMVGEDAKTYSGNGLKVEDYYCFGKPIVSPSDGYVTEIVEGIDDNQIGDFELKNNWGNSVVISHGEGVFSQLSHLKKGSITVVKGQYVRKGELLASCGNSGRSPYPHLHFQFQSLGELGAATLNYPFSAFLTDTNHQLQFHSASQPKLSETVLNNQIVDLLDVALDFVPGQIIRFSKEGNENAEIVEWKVEIDLYNNTYIRCQKTGSKAYFIRQPDIFYFTHFEGNRNNYLYDFFLGGYQLITGFNKGLKLQENITLSLFPNKVLLVLQDIVAPFYRFLNAKYTLIQKNMTNDLSSSRIALHTETKFCAFGYEIENKEYILAFENNQLQVFTIIDQTKKTILTRV